MAWKAISGFEGYYEVSAEGEVRSLPRRILMRQKKRTYWSTQKGILLVGRQDRDGYKTVTLVKENQRRDARVHHLVLEAFVGPCPDGMECRHLDGNPANNKLENLCWGTRKENAADRRVHGTQLGEKHPQARLSSKQVIELRKAARAGISFVSLGKQYGVSDVAARKIAIGKSYGDVQ